MKRVVLATVAAMLTFAFAVPAADAAPDRPPTPPPTDFWQNQGFMNMAHQGGERENPGNTLFAFKKAIADGADVIDMDITLTEDNVLIATHDDQPCHTSNAPCGEEMGFRDLTLAEVRAFDFGYWFSPGLATYYDKSLDVPHPYRGMATSDVPPPEGYAASDFKIATFAEILDAFPDTPLNVELKPYTDPAATATAAAAVLAAHPGRESDVIINSFSQAMIEEFHEAAPNHLALGGSLEGTLDYVTGKAITPTPVAVQPPDKYNLGGNIVDTLPLLRQHFEHDGFIAVVWPSDLDETQETNPWYEKLIGQGADAINTMFPSRLHEYLCAASIPRPDGSPRCAEQECPEGFRGIAPDCEKIPVTALTRVMVTPKKGSIKAGKTFRLKVTIRAKTGEIGPKQFRVNLRSSNRQVKLPGSVVVKLKGSEGSRVVTVRATRKAGGKSVITASNGKLKARANLTVKKTCVKKKGKGSGGKVCGKTNHF